jgi:hypothetical protein
MVSLADHEWVDVESMRFYGLDNILDKSQLELRLSEIPDGVDILVCHQLLDLTCQLDGMWNMKAEWVPARVPLVLMGDYHEPTVVESSSGTCFMYPGPPAPLRVSEFDFAKGAIHVYRPRSRKGTSSDISVQRLEIASRNVFSFKTTPVLDLSDESDLGPFSAFLDGAYKVAQDTLKLHIDKDNLNDLFSYIKDQSTLDKLHHLFSLSNLGSGVLRVRYNPEFLSADTVREMVADKHPDTYVLLVPLVTDSVVSNDTDQDPSAIVSLEDELSRCVAEGSYPEHAEQFVLDMLHPDRADKIAKWRKKFNLDQSPEIKRALAVADKETT